MPERQGRGLLPRNGGQRVDGVHIGPTPFLAVCGHVNIDVQLQVRELPRAGQSAPVLERRSVWGGTAANIARQAGGLGVPVRLWSRVGEDFPPAWAKALGDDGVDLAFMQIVAGALTPTCFILTDALDRQMYCMDQAAMANMAEAPPGPALVDGLRDGGWLHLATGDPLAYAQVAVAARERGIGVGLDPGQEMRFRYDRRALEGLLGLSDILFVNEEELRVACGLLEVADADALTAHVGALVVTRAARGASLYVRGAKTVHAPAFPVPRVVDPTWAGDAFRAGWYAALQDGRTMEQALRWGQAAAAIIVQHPGPQCHVLRPADVQALLSTA